ncbi:PIN domain-containing protein [bacterium]|nr:PIN domain-containing protein [bacterium]
MIFLDTHILVWLYAGLVEKIPLTIQDKLESVPLFISPMVELELNFLYEIGRLTVMGSDIIRHLNARLGISISKVDFYQIVEEAQQLNWTRDPFDRLIVANAAVFQAPLITKDERIQQHYPKAIWS